MLKKIQKYIAASIISSTLAQLMYPVEICATKGEIRAKIDSNTKKGNELKIKGQEHKENQKKLEDQIANITRDIENIRGQIKSLNKSSNESQNSIFSILPRIEQLNAEIEEINKNMQTIQKESEALENELLAMSKEMYMQGGSTALLEGFLNLKNFQEFCNTVEYAKFTAKDIQNIQERYGAKVKELETISKLKSQEIEKLNQSKQEIERNVEANSKRASEIDELYKSYINNYNTLKGLLDSSKKESKQIENARRLLEKMNKKLNESLEDPANEIEKAKQEEIKKQQEEAKKQEEKGKTKDPAKEKPEEKSKEKKKEKPEEKSKQKSSKGYMFPVKGNYYISQHYAGVKHPGIDISTYGRANPIVAAKGGKVIKASRGARGTGYGGYGNVVTILHDDGKTTLYGHLSSILVRPGQRVEQGHEIGRAGSTGQSSGVHLHFEVRDGKNNRIRPPF